jgi:hypothetical protein
MSTPMQDKPLFPFGPILFFGDSVTAELVAETPSLFSGPQTVARGIAGQSTRDMGRRLRSDIALYGARGLHLIGGRDDILSGKGMPSLDSIVADFAAMLQDARDLYVRTWVGSIPPVDPASPAAAGLPIPLIGHVNAWLRDHVQAFGAQFIDYDAVLATETGALRPAFSDDGVRLNAVGYAALRDAMMAALTAPGVEQIWAPPESEEIRTRAIRARSSSSPASRERAITASHSTPTASSTPPRSSSASRRARPGSWSSAIPPRSTAATSPTPCRAALSGFCGRTDSTARRSTISG